MYHYGNDDRVFRILLGSPEECSTGASTFDPRARPWYVAASSGPKDIIIILDTSGSMSNYGRLGVMNEVAKRVISTLVSVFFSVVEFNSVAKHVGESSSGDNTGLMQRANDANKSNILGQIDGLVAGGGIVFYPVFDLAFKTFKSSASAELSSGCHKAILFLTDGMIQDSKNTLMNLIAAELSEFDADSRPALFTYSFGSGTDSVVPKEIASANDGIWASIRDGGDLSESMGAYYKYFAYGLSGDENKDFVAWVAPYEFSTTGELGTTASAPVYDRSVDPPVLAGVVGLDFSFAAMERALGQEGEQSKNAVLERIVERSIATCPKLELNPCQLHCLREFGSGDNTNSEALCSIGISCDKKPLKSPHILTKFGSMAITGVFLMKRKYAVL